MSGDIRQFEIEKREVRRTAAHAAMDRFRPERISVSNGVLWLRLVDDCVRVSDLLAAIEAMRYGGWIDGRGRVEDELQRLNDEFHKTGQCPSKIT